LAVAVHFRQPWLGGQPASAAWLERQAAITTHGGTRVRKQSLAMATLSVIAFAHVNLAHAQDGPVSAKEIQDTWVGKDLTGTTANGARASLRLEPDGKATVSAGNTSDMGTWRISENGYCTTWKTIRAGQERCFTVVRAGSAFKVMNPDGSLSGQFTSVK
jgi:hypothetical protein